MMRSFLIEALTWNVCKLLRLQTWLAGDEAKTTRERAHEVADEIEAQYSTESWWVGALVCQQASCGWYVVVLTEDVLLTNLICPAIYKDCYIFTQRASDFVLDVEVSQ